MVVPALQSRVITVNGKVVGIQLDMSAMVRIYTRIATPKSFGFRVVMELPDILSNEEARRALGLPSFDRIVVGPSKHSQLEADLTLLRGNNIVGKYSVKASPTGNVDYIINSWRQEKRHMTY